MPVRHVVTEADGIRLRKNSAILFWHADLDNGFLSNLYPATIMKNGLIWATSEHLYQAEKHDDPVIREKIRSQTVPLKSKFVSRKYCKKLDRWPSEQHKLSTMRETVRMKFDQNPELKRALLETAPFDIIEDSTTDSYWGVGEDGNGENIMGNLLMELRDFYIKEQEKCCEFAP